MSQAAGVSFEVEQVGTPPGWCVVSEDAIADLRGDVREVVRIVNEIDRRVISIEGQLGAIEATDRRQDREAEGAKTNRAHITAQHQGLALQMAEHRGRFAVLYGVLAGVGVVALGAVATAVVALLTS